MFECSVYIMCIAYNNKNTVTVQLHRAYHHKVFFLIVNVGSTDFELKWHSMLEQANSITKKNRNYVD